MCAKPWLASIERAWMSWVARVVNDAVARRDRHITEPQDQREDEQQPDRPERARLTELTRPLSEALAQGTPLAPYLTTARHVLGAPTATATQDLQRTGFSPWPRIIRSRTTANGAARARIPPREPF
jgi:hypothetical protein